MIRRVTVLSFLLALAIGPYFVDLGGSSIWDANEAFYVETPREMMERGDYISPTFNYEPRLNKPVLSYWIVAGFYHLFGVSVAVQRIPMALGAIVIIAAAFFLAWAASPPDARGGESARLEAALWAALGLAVTPRLLMFARRIFIDIYITMFMALTLLFFALSERYPERRRTFLALMYASVGLGMLTKGPVALVLPAAAFVAYLLIHRELGRLRSMMVPAGVLIVTAIVAPWCMALYQRHGAAPLTEFILGENVARYTAGVGVDSERGPLFYLPVLFSDSFPWSMLLFAAAVGWWRDSRAARPPSRGHGGADIVHRLATLLWVWIAVIVAFFTASAAKQDLYIFPIVPAVAALAGLAILHGPPAGVRWGTCALGAIVTVAGAGLAYLFAPGATHTIEGGFAMGVGGAAGGLVVCIAALAGRTRHALVAVAITFVVLDWIFVLRVLPGFERYKPVPGFAQTLAPRLKPDDVLLTYDEALPSLVFYLRRHVDPYFLPQEVVDQFKRGKTVYAVMSDENYRDIKGALGVPTCVIDRRPTFDVKLRQMIARNSLPELLLVTNQCDP